MTTVENTPQKFSLTQIAQTGGIAALGAVIINAILFFIADVAGVWDDILIPPSDEEMFIVPVMFASIVGITGGTIVFALLNQFSKNPIRIFQIVAVIVLLFSFTNPLTVPDADLPFILTLEVMHIVAGGLTIALFTRLGASS